ncbi:MAG: hypothetical protein ACYTXF_35975, partial [Nostoc sp.]
MSQGDCLLYNPYFTLYAHGSYSKGFSSKKQHFHSSGLHFSKTLCFSHWVMMFSEIKKCLLLAIPLSLAQVAQGATGFVDTVMM